MRQIYRQIAETSGELLRLREQLALFQVGAAYPSHVTHEDEDWDYATADTKTETHCFHIYPAMMIPQVARRLIRMFARKGDVVLDPFCGSGTVLVEARIAGHNSWGIDINPLALLIARAKTTPLDISVLQREAVQLFDAYLKDCWHIEKNPYFAPIPDFFNIDYWFTPSVSRYLSALRSRIIAIRDTGIREFFLVAFSETVREVSLTRNDEFKLFRTPPEELGKHNPKVGETFFSKVWRNLSGMAEFARKVDRNAWVRILQEDTRRQTSLPPSSVNLVVTSPPYGDSRTTVAYGQFSRLSLQWLGLPWEEARDIDSRSLGGVGL